MCEGELHPLRFQKRLKHRTEISHRQHLPRIFSRSLFPAPRITGLRGNSELPRPRPAGRCRELSPSFPKHIPRWMRPREAPGPGAPPAPPAPFVRRNSVRGGRSWSCRGARRAPAWAARPSAPSPRSGPQGAASSCCGASPRRDTDCWKPRKVTRGKACPRLRPLFNVQNKGARVYVCVYMYVYKYLSRG